MRRSTFLIALALITVIVVSYVALVLVDRVQTDPLQVGASQVARLSEDVAYEVPAGFGQPDDSHAYDEFLGMRVIISGYGTETEDVCILVYPSESISAEGMFTGPAYSGCAAGAFPAAVALRVASDFPEQLRESFPDGTALQFVLDRSTNEVVVFADQ